MKKKFVVLLGARHIVIKKVKDGGFFDFRRLNPTRIGPHLNSLLVYISATNRTMNNFIKLKFEIKDKVFENVLYQKSNSYIILMDPQELLICLKNKKDKYTGLLDFSIYEKNFIFE